MVFGTLIPTPLLLNAVRTHTPQLFIKSVKLVISWSASQNADNSELEQ